MIIVKILGGLGNQMFQYAAGRRLSLYHKTPMKLDVFGFANYDWHTYGLKSFQIQDQYATPEEVARANPSLRKGFGGQAFRLWRRFHLPQRFVFHEPALRPYNSAFLRTRSTVYLDGYWQSEKYFADISDIIRREFTFKPTPDEANQKTAAQIQAAQSVSLHIRRGNYVAIAAVNKIHGTCSLEYYQEAVKLIAAKVITPHFFVFSDDPGWTQENLQLPFTTTYVTHNADGRDYEDLRLMSYCRHNILANSSFSWWGAWLGEPAGKIVVAPNKWFNDPSIDTRDLIPPRWTRI